MEEHALGAVLTSASTVTTGDTGQAVITFVSAAQENQMNAMQTFQSAIP